MELKNKRVLVVGLGKTGEALCEFLLEKGAFVKVSEKKQLEELGSKAAFWEERGVKIEAGGHFQNTFRDTDLIVTSPGVPPLPEFKSAKAIGIKVISEIELAFQFLKGKIIGITGSNGKSTTTTLTHEIIQQGGISSYIAGNIGTPLISLVKTSKDDDWFVTELSSFQLENIEGFKAAISIFLNLSPDHLDWHGSYDDYFKAKVNLFKNQEQNDFAILNRDDPRIWDLHKNAKFQVFPFSRNFVLKEGCFLEGQEIILSGKSQEKLMKVTDIPLKGVHNQENIMAAASVGFILNIPASSIKNTIMNFSGLEHRLEKVINLQGVDFYNDSKATNVDATLTSIRSFDQKIILILGGRDKGGDFSELIEPIKKRVKKVILIGEASQHIANAIKNTVPLLQVTSMREAILQSFRAAASGEVVLLAPACTSFDMFQNFEERGRHFKQEILSLKKIVLKEKLS